MKLRNRKSHVTSLPEGQAPVSRGSRVTKWLYYLLLAAVLFYAGWHVLDYMLYVEVRGQIEVEKTRVSPSRGGLIEHIGILEGQRVKAGDLLASIGPAEACWEEPNPRLERLRLERDLNARRLELKQREIRRQGGRYQALAMHRALELDAAGRREALELRRELEELRNAAALLRAEMDLQDRSIAGLSSRRDRLQEECVALALTAPFDATVTAVLHRSHEYVGRGEPLIMLAPRAGVARVQAYPDVGETGRWYPDAVVEVLLPDGGRTLGLVEAVHSAAYEATDLEREDYVPVTAQPRVDVGPPDTETAAVWRRFDRMEVFVRQRR